MSSITLARLDAFNAEQVALADVIQDYAEAALAVSGYTRLGRGWTKESTRFSGFEYNTYPASGAEPVVLARFYDIRDSAEAHIRLSVAELVSAQEGKS